MNERKAKERREPPRPEPVSFGGVRYEAVLWGKSRNLGQNGGFVVAIDEVTGTEKWIIKVYDVIYDQRMEEDKQDVFISSLELDSENLLHVVNEKGAQFMVNVETQEVTKWPK